MTPDKKQCQSCCSIEHFRAVFCSLCGNRFHQPITAVNVPKKSPNLILIAAGSLTILFLLFGLGMIAAIIGTGSKPASASLTSAPSNFVASGTPTVPAQTVADAKIKIVGKVVGISDGDTATVLDSENKPYKIRLEGIDAPESKQDFGAKAKQHLFDLIYGKTVTVLSNKTDKYGRTVGKILLDGKDINLEQVKGGFAWHYKQYAAEQSPEDRKLYADAETAAKSSQLSLWSISKPTAPWDFRKGLELSTADAGKVFGNKNSLIYHWSGCPGFSKTAERNRVYFATTEEAEAAGYRAALNCSTAKPTTKTEDTEEAEDANDIFAEGEDFEVRKSTVPAPYVYTPPTTYSTPNYSTRTYPTPAPERTPDAVPVRSAPSGASARCADGTYSYSANRRGTCSHHGGVAEWIGSSLSDDEDTSPSYSTPAPSYSTPSSAPKTVNVRGYTRRDGTYVRPHTRSAPRRRN